MKKNPEFYESQRFRQWWLVLLMGGVIVLFLFGFIRQIIFGLQWGNNPMSNIGLIIVAVGIILFTLWFFFLRLDVEVNKEGIYWRFFLLEFKGHFLSWDEIAESKVSKYNPMAFGGWGLRVNGVSLIKIKGVRIENSKDSINRMSDKTTVYSVSGHYALHLTLINGKKVLIGTQHPEELAETLEQIHGSRNKK